MGINGKIEFQRLEGDREAKSSLVTLSGEPVGIIEVIYTDEFENPSSRRRVWKFSEVVVALTGKRSGPEATFPAENGYNARTGVAAAKRQIVEWLK